MTYNLEVEREGKRSDCSVSVKGAGMTYFLKVERKRSNHSHNCKGGRDNIQSGGGQGGQEVRSQLQLQRA
jgi:hypothetical protein